MTDSYRTVAGSGYSETVIERSRFLGTAEHVESAEQAMAVVERVRKTYPDATHHCFGYIADRIGNELKFSDAGEPQGTAGMPILDVLVKKKCVETVLVVTRYFGGVKLGAGGLVRAYSGAAAKTLENAGVATRIFSVFAEFTLDYSVFSRTESAIRKLPIAVENLKYADGVTLKFAVSKRNAETVFEKLDSLSLGKGVLKQIKEDYFSYESEVNLKKIEDKEK